MRRMVVQGWGAGKSGGVSGPPREDTRVTPPEAVDEGFGLGTCREVPRDGLYEQPGPGGCRRAPGCGLRGLTLIKPDDRPSSPKDLLLANHA